MALPLDSEEARASFLFYRDARNNPDAFPDQSFPGILAHHKCIRKVQYTLLKRLLLMLLTGAAIATIGVLIGFSLFFSLIAAVILVIPLSYFEFKTPLPVECHFYVDKYIFSFKDKQYAKEFARLNDTSVKEGDYTEDFPRSYKNF